MSIKSKVDIKRRNIGHEILAGLIEIKAYHSGKLNLRTIEINKDHKEDTEFPQE